MTAPLLVTRGLRKHFPLSGTAAVSDLSIEVGRGEIVALIGPSGCGKTTSLRMVAGFEQPDQGQILLSGRDITAHPPQSRGIGMVFQDYALFPHMTVAENIRFGARDRSAAAIERYLALVGLTDYRDRYPEALSGGQQQRVALARSFAAEPELLLLDEPFSNLDAGLRSATRREIRKILKASQIGILVVTHDQEEALSFADRVVVMRDGVVEQQGRPQELYDSPATPFVASFLGRTNFLRAEAHGLTAASALGDLSLATPHEGEVWINLRPERISLRGAGSEATAVTGEVTSVEFKGHDLTYLVRCGALELQVDAMHGPRFEEGDQVAVHVDGPLVPLKSAPAA